MNLIHPIFLKDKADASKEDNLNWWEEMCSPFANDYWKADFEDIATLEKMGYWDIVDHTTDMHVIELYQ